MFAAPLADMGVVVTTWDRPTDLSHEENLADFAAHARGADVTGGLSYGAHLAAHWALQGNTAVALVLALPAWTGPPSDAARLTAAAGDEVTATGIEETVRRIERDAPAWVAQEMRTAWSAYDERTLAQALHTAASSAAPTRKQLQAIATPAVVIGMTADPFHPIEVAREWADALPNALLVEVDYDVGAVAPEFGDAAASALSLIL